MNKIELLSEFELQRNIKIYMIHIQSVEPSVRREIESINAFYCPILSMIQTESLECLLTPNAYNSDPVRQFDIPTDDGCMVSFSCSPSRVGSSVKVSGSSRQYVRMWGDLPTCHRGLSSWRVQVERDSSEKCFVGIASASHFNVFKSTINVASDLKKVEYIISVNPSANWLAISQITPNSFQIVTSIPLPFQGPFLPYIKVRPGVKVTLISDLSESSESSEFSEPIVID